MSSLPVQPTYSFVIGCTKLHIVLFIVWKRLNIIPYSLAPVEEQYDASEISFSSVMFPIPPVPNTGEETNRTADRRKYCVMTTPSEGA